VAKVKYKSAGRSFTARPNPLSNSVPRRRRGDIRVLKEYRMTRPVRAEPRSIAEVVKPQSRALVRALSKAEIAAEKAMAQPMANRLQVKNYASIRTAGGGMLIPQLGFGMFVGMHRTLVNNLFRRMTDAVNSSWIDMICGVPQGVPVVGLSALCGPSGTAYTINRATKADPQWEYAEISTLGPPIYPPNLFGWRVNGRAKLKTGSPAMARFPHHPSVLRPALQPSRLIDVFPWIDPLSMPYGQQLPTPQPRPWGVRPRHNPMRSRMEQPEPAPAISRDPAKPGRIEGLEGLPAARTSPQLRNRVVPRTLTRPDGTPEPGIVAPPRVRDQPPAKNVKERKGRIGHAYWSLLQAYGAYTEMKDLIDYTYEALPQKLKRDIYRQKGRQPNAAERATALYQNFSKVRLGRAAENIIFGNLQDFIFAAYSKPGDKLLQKLVPKFEDRMLMRAMARQMLIQGDVHDPVADYLRNLIKRARKDVRPVFDAIDK